MNRRGGAPGFYAEETPVLKLFAARRSPLSRSAHSGGRSFRTVEQCQRLPGGDKFCSEGLQFGHGSLTIFGFQSLDCILYHGNAAVTLKQSLCRETNAVFRNYSKDYEFGVGGQALYEFGGVQAFEDVECLFFEQYLLVLHKIAGQCCGGLVRDDDNFLRERLGNIGGARGAFDTVRGKSFTLPIHLSCE